MPVVLESHDGQSASIRDSKADSRAL